MPSLSAWQTGRQPYDGHHILDVEPAEGSHEEGSCLGDDHGQVQHLAQVHAVLALGVRLVRVAGYQLTGPAYFKYFKKVSRGA